MGKRLQAAYPYPRKQADRRVWAKGYQERATGRLKHAERGTYVRIDINGVKTRIRPYGAIGGADDYELIFSGEYDGFWCDVYAQEYMSLDEARRQFARVWFFVKAVISG